MKNLITLLLVALSSVAVNAKTFTIGPYSGDQLRVRVVADRMLVDSCNPTMLSIVHSENRGGYYSPSYKLFVNRLMTARYCEGSFQYYTRIMSNEYILDITPGATLKVNVPSYIDRLEIDPIL